MTDFQKEGSITFWLTHEHKNWVTNNAGYNFGTFTESGISLQAIKHPDRTVEIVSTGPLASKLQFRCQIPPCDERGLFVAVTWNRGDVSLYLNGKPADEMTSLGPGASA